LYSVTVPSPLRFDNRFVRELPGDPLTSNERRQVLRACWSPVGPTPVAAPTLLAHAREVADLVGFGPEDHASPRFAEVFGGNALLTGMEPYAACYGGHQFGHWAGQLGDGRAITLGEAINEAGERWELQLKGAGPTPYSRTADGRAVLRSSIREFLCSEAMHHLGIPTTRALSVVTTGEQVLRDMFYDGNAALEPGAVVCRVAPSFIRFGNFEILAARDEHALLRQLVDFTIARDFPEIDAADPDRLERWFTEVCVRTATMIVGWMRVGFVHGVMNTDNMSILGLTIDYGPYGWLDNFDPNWTPNTTDAMGRRYRYSQQPAIAQWNLERLADAIRPLVTDVAPLKRGLGAYVQRFNAEYRAMLAAKFGFAALDAETEAVATEGLSLLQRVEMDYTQFFRALGDISVGHGGPNAHTGHAVHGIPADDAAAVALLGDVFYDDAKAAAATAEIAAWLRRWSPLATAREGMHRVNPRYVLRNYLAQQAIDQATAGDPSMVHELLDVMRRPYDVQPGREAFAARRPEWARHRAGCSMLSCSS
jgi:uncharacterized protein YdiU (UPF0061 family)